ncbi:MAG: FIST C-terminal domain-containing protein [Pontiellaceae bacterium]|nr:FIST C-terminal domain-containing protein [Pontiellaceae bacterium]MBN2785017.1 FIST C-terminal domain-containing protein [Pontiellaceae bacterium]
MKTKSCYSTQSDPYRAGNEIGAGLAEIDPEVIFLFPSIHYRGSPELAEAIYDELNTDKAILIGSTGDGFFEKMYTGHVGVSALGINSGGKIRWHMAASTGVGSDPVRAAARCTEQLKLSLRTNEPKFYFLCSDFRTDTTQLVNALKSSIRPPLVGGSAADDFSFDRCYVYANREVREDCMALLAAEGDFEYEILVANEMQDLGRPGIITACHGTMVQTINERPANQFIEEETGQPLNSLNEGVLTIKLMNSKNEEPHLRSMLLVGDSEHEGSILLFGGVDNGDVAQICHAPPERVLENFRQLAGSIKNLNFVPSAALLVSCAGRKRVLGESIREEVELLKKQNPEIQAIAGYPSYGEFGPIRQNGSYSATLFHNMTCIMLLIGEKNT